MSLQIKLIHFCSLNKILKNGHIALRVKFVLGRILTRRYKTNSFINSFQLLYLVHTIGNPLPNFVNALILLFSFLSDGVINFDE